MTRRIEDCVPLERMYDFFVCDAVNGVLRWKSREELNYHIGIWNKRFSDKPAGRLNTAGHLQIVVKIDGIRYHTVAHRVIWSMLVGEWVDQSFDVDHRNGRRSDNRIGNLRVCLPKDNAKNRGLYRNNTSGFKGVSWVKKYEKWGVQIQCEGRTRFKGYFDSVEEAAVAYDVAAQELFGEYARLDCMTGQLAA